jgi:hypothetical protein
MFPSEFWEFYSREIKPSIERLRFGCYAAILAVSTVIGGLTLVNHVGLGEVRNTNQEQKVEIEKLKHEVSSIREELGKISLNVEPEKSFKLRPTYCECVIKDNTVNTSEKKFIRCPTKNFTCDKESRDICEKQHPEYEC